MKSLSLLCITASFLFFAACNTSIKKEQKPNVILIMADDMGYECLGSYGSTSYQTPVLDQLAASGIRVSHCISQPLCTPSRVKIMTGQHNYRNYSHFGFLKDDQYTFGKLMKEVGYNTCIAGKWQLNGLSYKDELTNWNDPTRPNQFGFDEYCLWQLTKTKPQGERFSEPLIEQNGAILEVDKSSYGPELFCNFILDFMERKKEEPFFIYYPMVLVHDPFVPTPQSDTWDNLDIRYKNDTSYFKDMVAYTDFNVGRIINKLDDLKLRENTIVLFTGDNGTHFSIVSQTESGEIRGGKGNTTDAGTRVPMIISWPKHIENGSVFEGLIDFSDFFATLAEIAGKEGEFDGLSFLPLLQGEKFTGKETSSVHYDPRWGKRVNQYRNQFARTIGYKLYQDGKFYKLSNDVLEQQPLLDSDLSQQELKIKVKLQEELDQMPTFPEEDKQ